MEGVRLLIVEDERITAEDLRDILTDLGYHVINVVSNGAAAISEVEQETPDLVLMDIRIQGDLDGTETARILRERFDTPVVFLTAHSDEDTLARAKAAEPLGYIVKPFQETELRATIEMALHKNTADRQRKAAHEQLSAAVDTAGEGVICVDAEGNITLINPAAESWTGWSRSEATGRNLADVFRLVKRPGGPIELPLARVLRDGFLRELEPGALLVARNGSGRPVGGTIAPVRDHSGNIQGVVLVFGDSPGKNASREPAVAVESATPVRPAEPQVIAHSHTMQQLLKFAHRVAASEASTILLEGESGVGKDVLARYIHENSKRKANAFLAVNCAAIPETLIESELFGYEKGAFTDARSQKQGILELASGGTAFLDEVGELPLILQAKLLRVLEDHRFRRLGGTKDVEVDLRVVAATNRELRRAIEQGRFRLDLYYRLNVIQLSIPPLRERKEDILPLANFFVALYNRKFGIKIEGIAPDAVSVLFSHDWPGNVRELRNIIERGMLMAEGKWIEAPSLGLKGYMPFAAPAAPGANDAAPSVEGDPSLAQVERSMVVQALEKAGWNQTRASKILKVSRDTLRYKMKKFNLKAPADL